MSKVSNKQYAEALYEVTRNLSGADLSTAVQKFVEILVRANKLKQADKIIVEFEKYSKKQEGVVELEITSARKLDEETIEQIKKAFSAKGGPASGWGDDVEVITGIDKKIIGGIKIKLEDKILDGSLKTQLKVLKHSLNS